MYHPLIHVKILGNAGCARFTSLDMIELEQSSYIFVLHLEHKKMDYFEHNKIHIICFSFFFPFNFHFFGEIQVCLPLKVIARAK